MKIFSDRHHGALTKSLKMLFEDRLGHELYFPHGREWFEEGYWMIAKPYNDNPVTINQYLVAPTDEKRVTYQGFLEGDFDVMIASYNNHVRPYHELLKRHQLKTKLIHQMGNEWPVDWRLVKNLLGSIMPASVPSGTNAIFYHQEFDLDTFHYAPPSNKKICRSFVHSLIEHEMYKQDWLDFQELEKLLPEYKFESYGILCRDGISKKQEDIAEVMRETKWGIHLKNNGDGYGHVIHNWFAVGRPVVYRSSHYEKKLAQALLIDMQTGIDLDRHSLQDTAKIINDMSDAQYLKMCNRVHNRFKEVVDFDKEGELIKKFMEELI